MKLGKLNAAIDAAPNVFLRPASGGLIAFQKGSIKAWLKERYPEGRGQETSWKLDADFAFATDENPEP